MYGKLVLHQRIAARYLGHCADNNNVHHSGHGNASCNGDLDNLAVAAFGRGSSCRVKRPKKNYLMLALQLAVVFTICFSLTCYCYHNCTSVITQLHWDCYHHDGCHHHKSYCDSGSRHESKSVETTLHEEQMQQYVYPHACITACSC